MGNILMLCGFGQVLFEPRFLHPLSGYNYGIYYIGIISGLNEIMHVKSLHIATQQNSSSIIKLYRLLHFCIVYLISQELFYTFTLFHNYVYSDYLHCLPQLTFYPIFPFSFAGFQPTPSPPNPARTCPYP